MLWASRGRSTLGWVALFLVLAALGGCGSAPRGGATGGPGGPAVVLRPGPAASGERDGADAQPPSDLASVPDAEPQIEPIRKGGPNKPYEALGRDYVPITDDRPFSERGLASWYGRKFHGHRTASGEPYNMYAMTAAHPTLPIPSYVRVRNPANDREVIVRVNDRGPFHPGRVIDLSYTAAYKLGVLKGVSPVELSRITFDEIRAGSWRKSPPSEAPDRPATELATARPAAPAAAASTVAAADPIAQVASGAASELAASATEPVPLARPRPGFWVQLGVFRQRDGADGFHRRVAADLDWLAPVLAIFGDASAYRLQAGPYASRDEAQGVARRVRDALSLVPVIVERR
ncbi:MAG TPA: septal ring lytic transglycosylase RlpA family protein [Albitalea sp.]|nr:septal ring lytic transglycosylase RlpA family protein [Albitalea sp.]